jgi:hypothetical protein
MKQKKAAPKGDWSNEQAALGQARGGGPKA